MNTTWGYSLATPKVVWIRPGQPSIEFGRCRKQGQSRWPVQDRRRGLTLAFPSLFLYGLGDVSDPSLSLGFRGQV